MFLNPIMMKRFADTMFGSGVQENCCPCGEESYNYANIYESDNGYIVKLALPGVKNEDIDVNYSDGILEIKAHRNVDVSDDVQKLYINRKSFDFTRKFKLPNSIDVDKIEAKLENGLLTIDIPKSEKAKPKTIEVKVK